MLVYNVTVNIHFYLKSFHKRDHNMALQIVILKMQFVQYILYLQKQCVF